MDQKIQKIKAYMNEGIRKRDFPGVSIAMSIKGEDASINLGYKQLIPQLITLDDHCIYDIASLTKVVFTTTAIMLLIEKDKISLDTKISDVLSWFKHKDMSIYDILIHSSGLPADIKKSYTYQHKDQIIDTIKDMDIIYDKHAHIVYSDVGFILLGLVIETITGMSLDEYGKTYIFEPLSMYHTTYHPIKDLCAPTEYRDDETYQGMLQGLVHDEKAFACGEAGHAGLFSTASDLLKFCKSILYDERILKRSSIKELQTIQITKPDLNNMMQSRALGWQKPIGTTYAGKYIDSDTVLMHTGFTGCHMVIDFKRETAYVALSNAVHPKRTLNHILKYREELSNIIMGEK